MALIHPKSCECLHSGLDLFSVPPTQTAVEDGQFLEVHPLATLAYGAPIEFSISGVGEDYIDLFNTFLHVRAKVTLPNGDDLPATAEVSPINYYLHSLFSQVDVSLNDTLISPSENSYPYRAYLEALLNYGEEAKKSHLTSALYYQDTVGHMTETKGENNKGLAKRRSLASYSVELDMMGRLHSDIFNQDRYMLNGVDIKIKLTPSKSVFNLIATEANAGYKSVITYATLLVRKAKLNPAISLAHEKALLRANAKYPIKRVVVKTFSIPKGMFSHTQDNLFLSQTPTRVVIGLVNASCFNGELNTNPFIFRHYELNYLSVMVDGRNITGKPLTMNYNQNQYVRAFHGTNLALGLIGKDVGNGIDYDSFSQGHALYAFDLTPSILDGEQFELARSGPLSLELKFGAITNAPLQVVIYAELDSVLEISKTRQVLTDYVA